ncbi:hypothetical protein FOL47_008162 [Perkinsus chesapeaki]|uniref:Uncharacterized protein n=1 Tax=Perkinsus chesapeaki TaxID=330153 RepID=A0A7J6MU75_PERCH|nr:hypothetical protein FOL47_008162 [Perkinsus chesapeaki]
MDHQTNVFYNPAYPAHNPHYQPRWNSEQPLLRPAKSCCGGRFSKRQCACCVCCVLLILLGLLMTLLLFFLAPVLAEDAMNSSEFYVESMEIIGENTSECDSDAAFCLDTALVSTLPNNMMFGASVEPFIATISTERAEIGYASMPSVKVKANSNTTIDETVVMVVTNRKEFDRFSALVISSESVKVNLQADLTVETFGIKFSGLKLDRVMTFKGLGNFTDQQPAMVDLDLTTSLGDVVRGRARFLATLLVENPSIVSVSDVGVIFGDIMYGKNQIGMFKTDEDLSIAAGKNSTVAAELEFKASFGMLKLVGDLILTLIGGDDVWVDVKGRNSSNHVFDAAVKSIGVRMLLAGR